MHTTHITTTRKLSFVVATVAAATGLSSQFANAGTYIEVRAGWLRQADFVGSMDIDAVIQGDRITGRFSNDLSYNVGPVAGAEIGIDDILGSMRVALSIDSFGSNPVGFPTPDIRLVGFTGYPDQRAIDEVIDFNALILTDYSRRATVWGLNGSYDFDMGSGFTPFAGAGIGMLILEDADENEPGFSLHAGFRYRLTETMDVGARLSWFRAAGPTHENGLEFDDFETMWAAVSLTKNL